MQQSNINWDATAFFASITDSNKFAKAHDFVFARVSGLDGFEEALQQLQSATAFVAVSDISQGYIEVNNSPHTRRVKTVFLAMRHALGDMTARQECMDTMRELFRQFMSKLILEKQGRSSRTSTSPPASPFRKSTSTSSPVALAHTSKSQ